MTRSRNANPLRTFVLEFSALLDTHPEEHRILDEGRSLLAQLLTTDDWLDPVFAEPDPNHYCQHLLHCDSAQRFSIVSFVWGAGQSTPVHNHTVWGLVGVLRGREHVQRYQIERGLPKPIGQVQVMEPGGIEAVSPTIGDMHKVSNGLTDGATVSIHIYGGNIGEIERSIFDRGGVRPFVSGYSNDRLPNFWRSSSS